MSQELERRLQDCLIALGGFDEILLPHWARRRMLRNCILETFPLAPALKPKFEGEQTVARYVRDASGLRAKLFIELDVENHAARSTKKERDEMQRELDHVQRLINLKQERRRLKQEKPQRSLFKLEGNAR